VDQVDAVLYTHEHADHTHGIDDLRAISARTGTLPVFGPPETLEKLAHRFDYIFDSCVHARRGTSKPQLLPTAIEPGQEVDVCGISVLPIELDHGGTRVYGYRFGDLAYLTDVKKVTDESLALLEGITLLVISALFDRPLPMHLSIGEAVDLARQLGAERTYLTHLTHQFTHVELIDLLPDGIEPAYDGLHLDF